jgi:hypothetical protein
MPDYNNILTGLPVIPGMSTSGQQAAVQNVGQIPQTNLSDISSQQQLMNANINPITGEAIKPTFFGKGGAAQLGISAISSLGSLWNSFQQNKIAKDSLALQTRTFETNLSNQTKTYNTELEDRIRTRYASERRNPSEADSYIERNKL